MGNIVRIEKKSCPVGSITPITVNRSRSGLMFKVISNAIEWSNQENFNAGEGFPWDADDKTFQDSLTNDRFYARGVGGTADVWICEIQ